MKRVAITIADGPGRRGRRGTALIVICLLMASAGCVAVAPTLMPDSYNVLEHSVSESGAQGVEGAWLARLGFLLLGAAVLILANTSGDRWGRLGRAAHRVYGGAIIGAAAFAHMPWEAVSYDEFEDLLHSITASAVGFSFTVGVLLVTFRRLPGHHGARIFDWSAIILAPLLSMAIFNFPGIAGLVQRVVFVIGYLWYGSEAVRQGWTREPALERAGPNPERSPVESSR